MNEKMKKALERTLRNNEKIAWESPTLHFGILDGKEGRKTLMQWTISTICYAAILAVYAAHDSITPRFFILLSIVYGALIITPILSYRTILGQRYFITNERIILIKKDGQVATMERDRINAIRLFPIRPGTALAFGKSVVEEGDTHLRWRSIHAKENPNNVGGLNANGLVFYNVERAEQAMQMLQIENN